MRPRRHEDALGFVQRERAEPEHGLPGILLRRDRDAREVLEPPDVVGPLESRRLQPFPVERDRLEREPDGCLQDLGVVFPKFLGRGRL